MELVSIIVPIYNVEPFLERCVQSILSQTYSEIEVILVDDGSPDRCPEICDEYQKKDPRVKVIHKPNGGLSDARNAGLQIAKGEMIAFVDSDDWISPYYVEIMRRTMLEENSDIVECLMVCSDGKQKLPDCLEKSMVESYDTITALKLLIEDQLLHQYVWNKLYKRTVIGDVCFPYGKCNEDEFWTYQVFGNAKKVSTVSSVLYAYFQRPGSIMGQGYQLKRLDAIEAKCLRQKYIEQYFPELQIVSMVNLAFSVMYAGQMSLKYLEKKDRKKAMAFLKLQYSQFEVCDFRKIKLPLKQVVWLYMAKVSFYGTCWVKDLLGIGL